MTAVDLGVIAAVVALFAFISKRLSRTPISPAIFFVVAGLGLGSAGLAVFDLELGSSTVRVLAETTLALVLFADASAINTQRLRQEKIIPVRLLGLGLPLTIAAGGFVAVLIFPELPVFEALVLAVLLAPTDAALGQAVVSDKRLPTRLRQGLNVESGLNDGICVPLLFAAVAAAEMIETPALNGEIAVELITELGVAIGVGLGVGAIIAWLWLRAQRANWMGEHWSVLVPVVAAVLAYVATTGLGGSGFIGAFVAGLVYGRMLGPTKTQESTGLLESVGGLLSALTFFVFGAGVVGPALNGLQGTAVAYAVLSLTVLRMVPVAVSLIGARAKLPTVAFAGWFGPRGLASIVFLLTVVEESNLGGTSLIVQVAALTVLLSVFAHGLTASWLTERYARWFSHSTEDLKMESGGEESMIMRTGMWRHGGERE